MPFVWRKFCYFLKKCLFRLENQFSKLTQEVVSMWRVNTVLCNVIRLNPWLTYTTNLNSQKVYKYYSLTKDDYFSCFKKCSILIIRRFWNSAIFSISLQAKTVEISKLVDDKAVLSIKANYHEIFSNWFTMRVLIINSI